jgi:hypothetical protein
MAEEGFGAGLAEFDLEEGAAGFGGVAGVEEVLHLGGEFVAECGLLADELVDEGFEAVVLVGGDGGGAGDDERGAGLVDEDGVDFIDDGEVVAALDLLVSGGGHAVVAKVIEAEFAVGAVGDVAGVLLAAEGGGLVVLEDADGEAEEFVELTHPFGVAAGEVVVDGDDMDAAAGEGVEVDGEGGDEGLAFAGGHFGDAAFVEHHAAEELDIEVDHVPTEGVSANIEGFSAEAAGGVFDDGEGLGEDGVELVPMIFLMIQLNMRMRRSGSGWGVGRR